MTIHFLACVLQLRGHLLTSVYFFVSEDTSLYCPFSVPLQISARNLAFICCRACPDCHPTFSQRYFTMAAASLGGSTVQCAWCKSWPVVVLVRVLTVFPLHLQHVGPKKKPRQANNNIPSSATFLPTRISMIKVGAACCAHPTAHLKGLPKIGGALPKNNFPKPSGPNGGCRKQHHQKVLQTHENDNGLLLKQVDPNIGSQHVHTRPGDADPRCPASTPCNKQRPKEPGRKPCSHVLHGRYIIKTFCFIGGRQCTRRHWQLRLRCRA